jgi:4-hydroxy-tetrahydrodipicolinate reductase
MRVGIAGIHGRMGQMLVHAVQASGATLVGGIDPSGIDPSGIDPSGINPSGIDPSAGAAGSALFASIAALAAASDVVIDFTHATAAAPHATALAAAGVAWVLGTTGLDVSAQQAVEQAAARIPIVQAANFSAGVALLLTLAERLGQALPAAAYDAEILEMHHRQKVDAPSGTAIALAAAVARGRGVNLAQVARTNRTGARAEGDIGLAALRGGQIVGEHTLSFTAGSEQIQLTHRAFDRAVFAQGAVRAAHWVHGRSPGLYGMAEVLGV